MLASGTVWDSVAYQAIPLERMPVLGGIVVPDLSNCHHIVESSIFLYQTIDDADNGKNAGGSGIIISVPLLSRGDLCVFYAITNWHVACKAGCAVARYVARDGTIQILDLDSAEWEFIPSGPDVAIAPVQFSNGKVPNAIPLDAFLSDEDDLFVGEDVFMVGRFLDYDGRLANKPALRFGAVSMLEASVRQETGYNGASLVLDMRSRSGFSGSPVFAYRSNGIVSQGQMMGVRATGSRPFPRPRSWGSGTDTIVKLVGIHWGQFPEPWELKFEEPGTPMRPLIQKNCYIEGMSGMTCAVPVTEVLRVLNCPKLTAHRDAAVEKAERLPKSESISFDLALGDQFGKPFGGLGGA